MTSNHMMSSSPPLTTATVSISTTASPQTVVIRGKRYRQRPLGPAPFASFEDLSDELESPPETARVPLPGIKEDPASQIQTPSTPQAPTAISPILKEALTGQLQTPATPRIDISRASSSSQHEDSVTSSPEREGNNVLGFKEDGTQELRSSTEELDYIQEPGTVEESEAKRKRDRMMKKQQQLKQDFQETQSEKNFTDRKDSNCSVMSEAGLLCISGRTSRLSSIGSAASGGSTASHVSGASHLSVGSHLSKGSSRSPSPHKMLLETSFCGSKPNLTQSIDAEAAPSLVSHVEKQTSRPPSRLRSRSPSPHKMLLETSFCGTKQFPGGKAPEKEESNESKIEDIVTAVEVSPQTAQKRHHSSTKNKKPNKIELDKTNDELIEKQKKKLADRVQKENEITVVEEIKTNEEKLYPKLPDKKPFPSASRSKKKKIISIRDIPDNEIFIPLTGPEVDFEELIHKGEPQHQTSVPESTEDCIFISLHTPPEELEKPIRTTPSVVIDKPSKKTHIDEDSSSKIKFGPRKYQVCKDGSIFIPLHSPEDDKIKSKFDEEIRKVDAELERAKEREIEEKQQQKPVTLDLTDSSSNRSRLSQSLSSNRPELTSGSRTPSPGSTISRKSSFASLFRRGEVSGSPDSPAASMVRKKSGTFSNILKEASDGLRERSRSRSKSGDRSSQGSIARSPSIKKNVFTNLFNKKKPESRSRKQSQSESEDTPPPPRLDLQFTFKSGTESSEGDYIIIPLKDPNDPPPPPDEYYVDGGVKGSIKTTRESKSKQPTPTKAKCITGSHESLKTKRKSKELEGIQKRKTPSPTPSQDAVEEMRGFMLSTVMAVCGNQEAEVKEDRISQTVLGEQETIVAENKTDEKQTVTESKQVELEEKKGHSLQPELSLTHDSSVELDDEIIKEEVVTVSDDGVRKLKLPPERGDLEEDHERKGLVLQDDSFDDELPYVPTTLPLERGKGVPIIPIKERKAEIKTFSIDRPRSITPINPANLEEFVTVVKRDSITISDEEKMKISLPREGSFSGKSKSPRKLEKKGKPWFEFAEAGIQSPRDSRKGSLPKTPSPPPPLPPRATPPPQQPPAASWINFEELPEKRKLPKRITTVPSLRGSADGTEKAGVSGAGHVVYSYVNPEECQCECHDHNNATNSVQGEECTRGYFQCKTCESNSVDECKNCENKHQCSEDIEERPLLDANSDNEDSSKKDWDDNLLGSKLEVDRHSCVSDSSFECASHDGVSIGVMENSVNSEDNGGRPFEMDLDVHSNRSSVVSQEEQEDPP